MFATVVLTVTINLTVIIMPQNLVEDKLTDYDKYKLLPVNQKAAIREAMTRNGISEPTVFRWIRERSMPLIWQKEFSKHLNNAINATK
jgi:hypothetical protein